MPLVLALWHLFLIGEPSRAAQEFIAHHSRNWYPKNLCSPLAGAVSLLSRCQFWFVSHPAALSSDLPSAGPAGRCCPQPSGCSVGRVPAALGARPRGCRGCCEAFVGSAVPLPRAQDGHLLSLQGEAVCRTPGGWGVLSVPRRASAFPSAAGAARPCGSSARASPARASPARAPPRRQGRAAGLRGHRPLPQGREGGWARRGWQREQLRSGRGSGGAQPREPGCSGSCWGPSSR